MLQLLRKYVRLGKDGGTPSQFYIWASEETSIDFSKLILLRLYSSLCVVIEVSAFIMLVEVND